jgi:hypothetical protein
LEIIMAPKNTFAHKPSPRLAVLAVTLLLLLLAAGPHSAPQPAAAQLWGIPVSEPASEPDDRVSAITPDPTIQMIIDQVDSNIVSTYDKQLAGEQPVWFNGDWYTITSRYTYSGEPIQLATSFVGQHLAALGLDVEYHTWSGPTYPNVIGELPGLTQPERIFIIGGHLDDVSGTPGADDNASGSVAALMAADIFTQYSWDCTLRFAFWTGEEQGLDGSEAYAQRASNLGENIEGYLNLDMIAYNTLGSTRGIDLLYSTSMPPTHDLALLFSDVVSAYGINLIPELRTTLGGGSDHSSFWNYGYTAILAIEDQGDFNPYYHGSGDTTAHTDVGYFTDFTKAALGTFAHMGCLLPPAGKLVGTVSNEGGDPIANAAIQAYRTPTQHWDTSSNPDGTYDLDLIGGTYTVTAQAPGYMNFSTSGVVVTNGFTTTLNLTMLYTPTFTLTGTVRETISGEPLFAHIGVVGHPSSYTYSDPNTGQYSLALLQGTYTLFAEPPYHHAQSVQVNLMGNQQQDFNLDSICLLVVGDDDAYGSYYTDSLDRLGYDYRYAKYYTPALPALTYFQGVVWLTGDQVTDTLTLSDQQALASYLDGGGRLFVSGQNIGEDIGSSSFFADYLHASFRDPDSGLYVLNALSFLEPLVDIFIQGGSGADNQTSPDVVAPAHAGEALYQYWTVPPPDPARYGGVAFTGLHRTIYFAFGFEAINRAYDRDQVMQAALNYLGTCTQPAAPQASFTASSATSRRILFANTSQGTPLLSYTWDFGDGSPASSDANPAHAYLQPGFYTVTLTVSSRYGQGTSSAVIYVPLEVYLPSMIK